MQLIIINKEPFTAIGKYDLFYLESVYGSNIDVLFYSRHIDRLLGYITYELKQY